VTQGLPPVRNGVAAQRPREPRSFADTITTSDSASDATVRGGYAPIDPQLLPVAERTRDGFEGPARTTQPREPRRQRTRAFIPATETVGMLPVTDGELLATDTQGIQPSEGHGVHDGPHGPHDDDAVGEQAAHLAGLLYLNLGKRDGVRVGEVARLLRENCELSRNEIGRIRVRDRYTFVDVPEERLDTIISTLSGQVVHDKALAPERAKTSKT
jgi:hypothetical protein